ncbi:MAG: 50S ribosome-binding GTPase [Candidatus Stahlbacteria bacterium]|nr:50S ribosome-binding GTPase [Candidatus Stahlbacteria bacterium]
MLIDTPGLRRRTKIETDVEYYSSVRTKTSISRCDVAILIVDGTIQMTHQDKRIIADIIEEGKGIIIVVNKIDMDIEFSELALRFATFIPVIYISALQGKRIYEPIKAALRVWKARKQRVSKKELAELQELKVKTRIIKITQIGIEPPTFHIRSGRKLKTQSIRFIEKTIRSKFNFIGSPIRIDVSMRLANQKLKSKNIKKDTNIRRRNPNIRRRNPDVRERNPDVRRRNSDVRGRNLGRHRRTVR